jgi:hypothetical protein
MIHYAATGFEGAVLHWFVNKVKDSTVPAFTTWANFKKELKSAFQPHTINNICEPNLEACTNMDQ